MNVATRWVGGCSLAVVAIAAGALLAARPPSDVRSDSESWREYRWEAYGTCPRGYAGEQRSRFVIDACLAEHSGWIATREGPTGGVIVEEHTPLARCLGRAWNADLFVCGSAPAVRFDPYRRWQRKPEHVTFHPSLPDPRPFREQLEACADRQWFELELRDDNNGWVHEVKLHPARREDALVARAACKVLFDEVLGHRARARTFDSLPNQEGGQQ